MKKINVKDDYGIINTSNQEIIRVLIQNLNRNNIIDENHIILNLEGCITDYPPTPDLVSFCLTKLSKFENDKTLEIIHSGIGTKELFILHDLVYEGDFLGIDRELYQKENLDEIRTKMNRILESNQISLIINCTNDKNKYIYGKLC